MEPHPIRCAVRALVRQHGTFTDRVCCRQRCGQYAWSCHGALETDGALLSAAVEFDLADSIDSVAAIDRAVVRTRKSIGGHFGGFCGEPAADPQYLDWGQDDQRIAPA